MTGNTPTMPEIEKLIRCLRMLFSAFIVLIVAWLIQSGNADTILLYLWLKN